MIFLFFILFAVQTPRPVSCTVTSINEGFVTVTCPTLHKRSTKRYIPGDQWPDKWAGKRKMGAGFPAEWINGHLVPRADAARIIQQMTREGQDYERNPVN